MAHLFFLILNGEIGENLAPKKLHATILPREIQENRYEESTRVKFFRVDIAGCIRYRLQKFPPPSGGSK